MLNYISLFSSAGIGCYGLKNAGFTCVATAELLEKRLNIQRYNNKCKYETGYISGDLTDPVVHKRLYDEINSFKDKEKISDLDLVIATPPCQGMSVANHKKNHELVRNSLVVESIKIVRELQPKFFIFENVSAFMKSICTDIDGVNKSIGEAIALNLNSSYYIQSKVINLKNYGSNSSRTRTIVIGVRRDQKEIIPLDLFPDFIQEKMLSEVIGMLPRLRYMGEFSPDDIYHSFRPYKESMYPWIAATPYGKSAFDNQSDELKPHKIIDGKLVVNQSKNGDKYQRQLWDKVGPCIHTRNDCLPSQNTVHPEDHRVFSIRELMLLMTIPASFKWVEDKELPSNSAPFCDKEKFRKKYEFNIRQCIGEAIPTQVITNIANKIKFFSKRKILSSKNIHEIINQYNLTNMDNLITFVKGNWDVINREDIYKICELSNAERLETAAFYTSKDICFSVLEKLPDFKKDTIRILEPSVGVGNFLPILAKRYEEKKIIIDCIDINPESLALCRLLSEKFISGNIIINYIESDFLLYDRFPQEKYDLVIGNPPYMKVIEKEKLFLYQSNAENKSTSNIFSFFVEKAISLGRFVSLIVPKALLNSPEYEITRNKISRYNLLHINDYNEKAFDVKIETISFLLETSGKINKENRVSITSYLRKTYFYQYQEYIVNTPFSSWLLYRDSHFDNVSSTLIFGKFKVFRDRQLTQKNTITSGKYRVIKSRNIANGKIINIEGYDRYVNELTGLSVAKFLNTSVILVPNLTYNPRAARLPENCIADGSAAILYGDYEVSDDDILYFSSKEFNDFYRVARNYGTRSMNIDSVSVCYFGIKK